jgi:hypothetical protein
MTKYLTKDEVFAAQDLPTEDVECPEWGGVLRVRGLNGAQRDAYEVSLQKTLPSGAMVPDFDDIRAKFVSRVVVDEKNVRMFTNAEVKKLSEKSAIPLDRICDVGKRLSGMSDDAVTVAEGNSDGQSDGSTTA